MKHKQAFTLVELSIVLVILGLLVGGVLTGQSLIRAAELRSITTQEQGYVTAVQTFRDKYFGLPGDITNGTAYWGYASGTPNCINTSGTSATTPGTCDGTGNGTVDYTGGTGSTSENLQFWRQLALAGLIEGNYSGLSGTYAGCGSVSVFGTSAPRGRISGTGWLAGYIGSSPGQAFGVTGYPIAAGNYGNVLLFSMPSTCYVGGVPPLKPEEAYNIDMKMDDGKPVTGNVKTNWTVSSGSPCTTGTSETDMNAAYNLSNTGVICFPIFANVF